jgi:hypothetical protein
MDWKIISKAEFIWRRRFTASGKYSVIEPLLLERGAAITFVLQPPH